MEKDEIFYRYFWTETMPRIISVLCKNDDRYYNLSQMAEELDIAVSSVSSNISRLEEAGILSTIKSKSRHRTILFRLNDTEEARIIKEMYDKLREVREDEIRN